MFCLKGRTRDTYMKKVDIFIEYLKKEEGLNDYSIQSVFKSIREEQFIGSVEYYVLKSEIKYRATADNYFSAISVFLNIFMMYILGRQSYLLIVAQRRGLWKIASIMQ